MLGLQLFIPRQLVTVLEHLDIMAEVDVGQVLDNHVESFAAEELDHLLLVVLVIVVEHVMGSTTEFNSVFKNRIRQFIKVALP